MEGNVDRRTDSVQELLRGRSGRRSEPQSLIRLGLRRSELVDVCSRQTGWFVLKFFDCPDVVTPMLSLFPLRFRGNTGLDTEADEW